jgi:hypothetical protein
MARASDSVTKRVVDAYDERSLSGRARGRRWRVFLDAFPDIAQMSVLDLGGDARAWRLSPAQPAQLILLNVFPQEVEEPWMRSIVGDACDPPPGLPSVDLVYSNSVIEHVGGHWRRQRFAETVHRAERYWVQTPNRYFPIEPHFMFPWIQHLPRSAQQKLVSRWPLGNYGAIKDADRALGHLLNIELLSATELGFYFPDAEIWREKLLGLPKSFVALRR